MPHSRVHKCLNRCQKQNTTGFSHTCRCIWAATGYHRGDSDVLWYYCMSECSPLMWPLCRESCSLAQLLRWLAAEEAAAQARQRTAIAHQPAWVLNLALLGGDGGIT